MPKYFTVDQANRTLPLVRQIVSDIVSSHRELQRAAAAHDSLEGGSREDETRRRQLNRELEEQTATVNRFIGELHEMGVLFKGFDNGLVDFYGRLDGRPVFLCWKLGEDRVEWWHEIEAGYVGRQRLPAHLFSGDAT